MTDTINDYADPSTGGGDAFKPADHKGALLLISKIGQVMDVTTEFGVASPIECDIAVLDGEHKGDTFERTYLFGVALIGNLKRHVGADVKVLGRLGQGDAKPGKSAPWILEAVTDADRDVARRYEAYLATQTPAVTDAF